MMCFVIKATPIITNDSIMFIAVIIMYDHFKILITIKIIFVIHYCDSQV